MAWQYLLWLSIALLVESGTALDIPYIFNGSDTGIQDYDANQLMEVSAKYPELTGVPQISALEDKETFDFPVVGGGNITGGSTKKNIGELKEIFDDRVEPENPEIHQLALVLAAKHPGDYTIDQICEIFRYLKYGNDLRKPWSYVQDPRGVDYFNYASKSLSAGNEAGCVGAGDCDDFAILMSALIESIGGTTRIILAHNNSTGGHAYAEVYLGNLNVKNNQVARVLNWTKNAFDIDKIYTHIDTNTRDVWINLDWGADEKGNAHPGGPFYQGDKHIVLSVRDKFQKTPLGAIDGYNNLPIIISLTPNKPEPQQVGTDITWIVETSDLDGDQIFYKFLIDGQPKTEWIDGKTWTWVASDTDVGSKRIEVEVRDGKHAGPDSYDSKTNTTFYIIPSSGQAGDGKYAGSDLYHGTDSADSSITPTSIGIKVQLHADMGDIIIQLYDNMPITAGNFKKLVEKGFYDGLTFHRVIDGFMIQGGDPNGDGSGGPGYTIKDELPNKNHNVRGSLAMANAGPNTGGSQFFINLVDNSADLDANYPVFGKVVSGMDVVDKIAKVKTDDMDKPLQTVKIISAKVIS